MKHKNISEGVLDVTDEEGWMAKSQLYKIAKYAGELHSMIGDTDQLEPWMQAKITKAADYMGAVKHYMEYSMVSNVAQAIVPADVEQEAIPMDVEPEAIPMESTEKEVNEAKPKDWKKAKGRGRYPRNIEVAEENALEEDKELQATAREFMGNALLKILDEAPTRWRWNPHVQADPDFAGKDAERDQAGMADYSAEQDRTLRRKRVAAASRGEDDTKYRSAGDSKRLAQDLAQDEQARTAKSQKYWNWVKKNRPDLWASKAFDK